MQKTAQTWRFWQQAFQSSKHARFSAPLLFAGLLLLLLIDIILNAGLGGVKISPAQIFSILLKPVGITLAVPYEPGQEAVFWVIRLPRIALGMVIGASLAVAGATMQGIFRNPLADPGLIGVSSGASLTAVASILFNFSALGLATLPVAAFIGGLLAVVLLYTFARHHGRTEVITLILTGVALNAMTGAATSLLITGATNQQLRSITFWLMGSLSSATWDSFLSVLPFLALGLVCLPFCAHQLNLLVLGEREARHLGVDTERLRIIGILLSALMVSASVSVCGIIGFVGLLVPHLVRLVAGPDHRVLLPASALLGAALLLLADLGARMLALPIELPLGAMTAFFGGPFFLFLLLRTRQQQGGWG